MEPRPWIKASGNGATGFLSSSDRSASKPKSKPKGNLRNMLKRMEGTRSRKTTTGVEGVWRGSVQPTQGLLLLATPSTPALPIYAAQDSNYDSGCVKPNKPNKERSKRASKRANQQTNNKQTSQRQTSVKPASQCQCLEAPWPSLPLI